LTPFKAKLREHRVEAVGPSRDQYEGLDDTIVQWIETLPSAPMSETLFLGAV
jgi:hypothetical protein